MLVGRAFFSTTRLCKTIRIATAYGLAFFIPFFGTLNQDQLRKLIVTPAITPVPQSKPDCLPSYAPDMPCLAFAEIQKQMQEAPDSNLLTHPDETRI